MALEQALKEQLQQYLTLLEGPVVLQVSGDDSKTGKEMTALVAEIVAMSPKLSMEVTSLERTPSFSVTRPGESLGIAFAGLPLGHEFSSLVLALLQVSGRAPKVSEEVVRQIKAIHKPLAFETFVSLSCHNCPDVVQALNIMSVLNPNITHTMVEGNAFKAEVEAKDILAVPAVYLNGTFFEGGRMTVEDILGKLGVEGDASAFDEKEPYDVLVIGGGPAGASAAIYAARKGIRTGIVSKRFGGQVMDTMAIENFISVPYTEGPKLAASLEEHVRRYEVDVMNPFQASGIAKKDMVEVTLENGGVLKSKAVILATGARWRQLGVPGEEAFRNKGVNYCPHCDGPLYEGKDVAVVGGGNSGVEAAIDLAGIVGHVTVIEFMPQLKADEVLIKRLNSLDNVTVVTNASVRTINGETKVHSLTYMDRKTEAIHDVAVDGVFIQIGLMPNTEWLKGDIDLSNHGEIVTDKRGATSMEGVFAAGDCTDTPYKQIIISMGSGANASLGAFDYLIRQ